MPILSYTNVVAKKAKKTYDSTIGRIVKFYLVLRRYCGKDRENYTTFLRKCPKTAKKCLIYQFFSGHPELFLSMLFFLYLCTQKEHKTVKVRPQLL